MNRSLLRNIIIFIALSIMLSACSDSAEKQTISFTVTRSNFIQHIPISGELEASTSTAISMPGGIFEPQIISWLAEENTLVKKGDIVAKFDATKYLYNSSQEQLKMSQVDITKSTKKQVLESEKYEITVDANLIESELQLADDFALEDLDIFSKNEIIDSMKNRTYLEAREKYNDWRDYVHDEKSESELALLDLQRQKHSSKLEQFKSAMQKMEIRAPHDGLFVLTKNRRGDKPNVGDMTWPGRKIASLPDLDKLQAKVQILESEAAGLAIGKRVEFTLDAYANELISGKIIQISGIAKSIEKNSPVKYFSATVEINSKNLAYWRPGIQLRGKIFVIEKTAVLSIPSQAIFRRDKQSYIYLLQGGQWIKRNITLGTRSLSATEILSGIEEGDIVALHQPILSKS